MQKHIKMTKWILIIIILVQPLILISYNSSFTPYQFNSPQIIKFEKSDNNKKQTPIPSIISGNELYAEQLQIEISDSDGLIHQAMISNDTNIFPEIDLSDPAFFDCAFVIQFSNGISSPIPESTVSTEKPDQLNPIQKYVNGFLYYINRSNTELIQNRKERALNILENFFQVDLIEYINNNSLSDNFYIPFYGAYPNWDVLKSKLYANLPNDGYWQLINKDRIYSEDYLKKSHYSSQIVYLNQYSMYNTELKEIEDNKFDLGLDLSMVDEDSGFTQILSGFNPLLGTEDDDSNILNIGDTSTTNEENSTISSFLEDLSNIITLSVNYEIESPGIQRNSIDETGSEPVNYQFDLFQALNFTGEKIPVSEKTFNSFDGITISTFSIGIYDSEPIALNPQNFEIDTNYLSQIESLLIFFDQDLNLSTFEEYSFKPKWKSYENYHKLYCQIQNLQNTSDFINLLPLLNPMGSVQSIPSAFIQPLENLRFSYSSEIEEPTLEITKNISSGTTYRILENGNTPTIDLFISNPTNVPVWGIEQNYSALGVENNPLTVRNLAGFSGNFFDLLGFDSARVIDVTTTLGFHLEELFHDQNPRFFMVDSNQTGATDYMIPEIINLNNILNLDDFSDLGSLFNLLNRIYPYSPEFTQLLIDNPDAYGPIANNPQAFNSTQSIFNPLNWKLEAGENITLSLPNPTTLFDSNYTQFFENQILDDPLNSPSYIFGYQDPETEISGSFQKNDGKSWNSKAEYITDEFVVEYTVLIRNSSNIPLENFTIDALNITSEFEGPFTSPTFSLEIFNFEESNFEIIPQAFDLDNIGKLNITFPSSISSDLNLSNYIDMSDDYTILLRMQFADVEDFTIEMDYFELGYLDIIDEKIYLEPASIYYTTELGNSQYMSKSNSILLSTDDSPSLWIENDYKLISSEGLHRYLVNISIQNQGNLIAEDIRLMIPTPGILTDINQIDTIIENNETVFHGKSSNFTIAEGKLFLDIDQLRMNERVENITFEIALPNSRISAPIQANWRYKIKVSEFSPQYQVQGTQNYIHANTSLYSQGKYGLSSISLEYDPSIPNITPCPNESFMVNIILKNNGNFSLFGLYYTLPKNLNGLTCLNESDSVFIPELKPNEQKILVLSMQKQKAGVYLLPQIDIISKIQPNVTNIQRGSPRLLGNISVELFKEISQRTVKKKNFLEIKVTLRNTGTIELGLTKINDIFCFDAEGFTLTSGIQIFEKDCVLPGENVSFSYQIQALEKEGTFLMRPALIEYWFIHKIIFESNSFEVIVRPPYWVQILPLLLSIGIGVGGLFVFYLYRLHHVSELIKFERRESLYFGQNLTEIAWEKRNITAFLDKEVEKFIGGKNE